MILGADWACPNVNPHELLNKLDVDVAPRFKGFLVGLVFPQHIEHSMYTILLYVASQCSQFPSGNNVL